MEDTCWWGLESHGVLPPSPLNAALLRSGAWAEWVKKSHEKSGAVSGGQNIKWCMSSMEQVVAWVRKFAAPVRTGVYVVYLLLLVTPIHTSRQMRNNSYSLAANNEATNVKYNICVLCFTHRIQFNKQFQMLNISQNVARNDISLYNHYRRIQLIRISTHNWRHHYVNDLAWLDLRWSCWELSAVGLYTVQSFLITLLDLKDQF